MKRTISVCIAAVLLGAGSATASGPGSGKLPALTVSFADSLWDGKTVPKGQQCKKFGGNGSTPSLVVEGIPAQANAIIVEFNDADYAALSFDGGHGKIGFWVKDGGKAVLRSVRGQTNNLPRGAFVEKRNRAGGSFAAPGYLPPCSGGAGHSYFAVVKAVYKARSGRKKSKVLATGTIRLGKY